MNSQFTYFYSHSFFNTSESLLPIPLVDHSMVNLGKGQAILGGDSGGVFQAKIYSITCSNRNCIISLLNRELSVPKGYFVAIPIPDTISGCITGGKNIFQNPKRSIQANICLTPQIQTASSEHGLGTVFAKITTTIAIVLLMGGTAVDPVSIENSAQNANAKLETLTKSQMQEQETASAMMRPTLMAASLMAGTAVELVSIPSTVLNVSALGKTLVS